MYLLDTNVFLEILMERRQSEAAKALLTTVPPTSLFVSDFTVHSLGVLLVREGQFDAYVRLIEDVVMESGIAVLSIRPDDISRVVDSVRRFGLDFDDAYQYAIAAQHGLQVVSLDGHFALTDIGYTTPADLHLQ